MISAVALEHADNYRLDTLRHALRRSFDDLGFPQKNPLSVCVSPGDTVFIKPNWVASRWRASCSHRDSLYCVITHPNVIEIVTEYVAEALSGRGKIFIGDNPSIDADFSELLATTNILSLKQKYGDLISIVDLRPLICKDLKYYGKKHLMSVADGDPMGNIDINLGKESLFYGMNPCNFRGVFNEREETIASHTGECQKYSFSRSIYDSDVYISIPKMKTHQKVGVTLNLKGLVGTVSNKNQLIHWRVGYPEIGGDEYPNKKQWELSRNAKVTHRGAWPGNDSIWRMVVDLYKGFCQRPRKYLSVVDGIMAGEGQGPFCPTAKHANSIMVGRDLLATDCAVARYMGFDPFRIRYLEYLLKSNCGTSLKDIKVVNANCVLDSFFDKKTNYLDFAVPPLWKDTKFVR